MGKVTLKIALISHYRSAIFINFAMNNCLENYDKTAK